MPVIHRDKIISAKKKFSKNVKLSQGNKDRKISAAKANCYQDHSAATTATKKTNKGSSEINHFNQQDKSPRSRLSLLLISRYTVPMVVFRNRLASSLGSLI
ncbi:hypothetical protein BpHYR1_000434 [Brachionus plicatilis]|uniref:Uncharacterized protein n=1 Tax=Brachionus plicatilis TaxID=10195 RepID=A0A3M7PXP6_BRAPC|nr:hypothetical protein BpHYR1_000434 [Brachionus plicatilis]